MKERLTNFGLAGLMFALSALLLFSFGGDAIREAAHRNDTFVSAPEVRLVEGRCKSKMLILTGCMITLYDPATGEKHSRDYAFLGPLDGKPLTILRSQKDGTFVTTDMGQEKFWMSLLTAMPMTLLFFLGGLKMLFIRPRKEEPDGLPRTA